MDGRGRAFDNIFVERLWRSVKHEEMYLKGYATMGELLIGLTKYFATTASGRTKRWEIEPPMQSTQAKRAVAR